MPSAWLSPTSPDIRLDIQGLRALAVLAVIVFHMKADWLPGGFLGVDVFFVVSGFVVSRVILRRGEDFSWLAFYSNRLRRIVPAYSAMLLVVALLAAVFLLPGDFKVFEASLRRSLLFTSNRYFASAGDYFAPAAHEWPLLHTWSLAVEMQFYLWLPLVLHLMPKRWLSTVLAVASVAGFGIAQWRLSQNGGDLQPLYYAMSARAPEFLMGAWLAAVQIDRDQLAPAWRLPLGVLGLAMMLSAFAMLSGDQFSPLTAVWPCAGVLMLIAAQDGSATGRWLSHRWLVLIGALSYSLYLWHWPLLALARYIWQDRDLPWPILLAATLCFTSMAWLSWRFIEKPWMKPQKKRRSTRVMAILAMMVAAPLASRPLNAGVVSNPPQTTLHYAPPDSICHGEVHGTCQRGIANSASSVLLFGDSHAAQLNRFMDAFGQAHGISATVLSASNCVPFPGFENPKLAHWAIEPCRDMKQAVKEQLQAHRTLILAGKWSLQVENPVFLPALRQFLKEADQRKQRVIVLAQLPLLMRHPVRALRFEALGIHTTNATTLQAREANARIAMIASGFPNVSFVEFDVSTLFDSPPFVDGELIYMDKHHLNEPGALRYARLAGPHLARLMSLTDAPTSP